MRKFWGWMLFAIAWLDAGVIFYNFALAPWRDEIEVDWVLLPYIAVLGLCLFGWYRLAIRKPKKD